MATDTAITRPTAIGVGISARPEPRPRPLRTEPPERHRPPTRPPADVQTDAGAWVLGSGILLIQACAVIPGLLPCLVLLLPLVVPIVVLGAVVGVLVGVPLGIWRLVASAVRSRRGPSPAP